MPKYRFSEIAYNSTAKKKPTEADKDTYIGLEHLDSGSLTVSRWGSDVAPIGEKLIMKKGDVLFGKRRAYQKKVAIAPFDGIFSAHGMVLRPNEAVITPEYFPLFISSDYFLDEAIRISVGSLSPTVNWKDLKDLSFNIPTIEEQKRITPLVWAAIESRSAYIALLESTDELVKSQFIEMFGDPFVNPYGLPMKTIGDVCKIEGGSQPPRSTFIFEPKEGYVRLVQIRDYKTDEHITYIPEKSTKKFCDETDIMIGRYGPPIFQILKGLKGAYNVALMKAVPIGINKEFLRFYLGRDELLHHLERFQTRTAGQAGIDMQELRNYPCPVPSEAAQVQFVDIVQQADKSKFVAYRATLSTESMIKWY